MAENNHLKAALASAREQSQDIVQAPAQEFQALIGSLETLDWRKLPPPLMAQILCRKPYRGKRNDPDYYLKPDQALFFALRCYELGISPLGNEAWFDRETWNIGITLEGQKHVIRNLGIQVGPPTWTFQERPWPPRIPKPSDLASVVEGGRPDRPVMKPIENDIGCTVHVETCVHGKWIPGELQIWLSEVYKPTQQWNQGTTNMLQVRSLDRFLGFLSGTGPSGRTDLADKAGAPVNVLTAEEPELKPMPVVEIKE